MDIVKDYVKSVDTIAKPDQRDSDLQHNLMLGDAHLRANQYDVVLRHQAQRLYCIEFRPPEILKDPVLSDVAPKADADLRVLEGCPIFLRPQEQVQVDLLRYRC